MNNEGEKKNTAARQAWRGWMVPAVGSAAFFASMLLGGFRNYKNYGFPTHVFTKTDWVLLSLPAVVVIVALSDVFLNGHEYEAEPDN
jgi:mannose/fructose/N-acetylgalactosamine-specific phosphotransferase system component IIC|tara:strand:+ start:17 stop:277 length:261 start_codon:yes stop_codon:yes gene_type:complete